jgi:hypothetical protein
MANRGKPEARKDARSKCKLKALLIKFEKEASQYAAKVEALEQDRVRWHSRADSPSHVGAGRLSLCAAQHCNDAVKLV